MMIMIVTVLSTLLEYTWDIEVWYDDNLPTLQYSTDLFTVWLLRQVALFVMIVTIII